jgi:hypothetical protein
MTPIAAGYVVLGDNIGSVTFTEQAGIPTPSDQSVGVSLAQAATSGSIVGIASDTLEGGEGKDAYVMAESQFATMDTIVGLNLGGASDSDSGDKLVLGGYLRAGDFGSVGEESNALQVENLLNVNTVVNSGQASAIEGVDLQTAVNTLFQAGGAFDQAGAAGTNAAGLFSWGGDTYLVAAGNAAGSTFGQDDYIVKVTGAAGTLDLSDFYHQVA